MKKALQKNFFLLIISILILGSIYPLETYAAEPESNVQETAEPDVQETAEPTATTSIAAPKQVTAVNSGQSIKITWKKVSNAEGYFLFRKNGGVWELIATIPDPETVSITDSSAVVGKSYYYKLQAYCDGGNIISKDSSKPLIKCLIPPSFSIASSTAGNTLTWDTQASASGYNIYRRKADEETWSKVQVITSGKIRSWVDISAANGKHYYYTITSYSSTSESDYASEKGYLRLKAPSIKSVTRTSSKMKVQWSANTAAAGYQIQYSPDSLFLGKKTVTAEGGAATSVTISALTSNATYYVRIRAYQTADNKKYYSTWTTYKNIRNTRTASATSLKIGTKLLELRTLAKQTLYQYDTLQGSCTDGTYSYFILYNRGVEKCKIAKVNLSTKKLVKVSSVLEVAHGNDMTYDTQLKRLVVIHSTKNPKRVSIVNPQTLCVEETKDIKIPSKISGATDAERNAITGFSAIAYNAQRKQYVMLLSKTSNLLILDQNLEVLSYVKTSQKNPYVNQGIDATDDYILLAQSAKTAGQSNIFSVYTWEGQYVTKINVKKGYEIESVFHIGKQFYAGFYRSYYTTYYTNEKKTVVVNGKKTTKTVKVPHRKLMRDNYIYKISNL